MKRDTGSANHRPEKSGPAELCVFPKLHDGTEVASDSEAWRHHCEAATVLAMPTLQQRRDYLAAVEKKRGIKAREALQNTMLGIRNADQKR